MISRFCFRSAYVVIWVGGGGTAYIAQVKGALASTKKAALDLKQAQRLDLAKRALQHIKIMQDEIAEVDGQQ